MSRRREEKEEEEKELRVVVHPCCQDFEEVLREVEEDEALVKIREDIRKDPDSHPTYTLEHDRLHYKGRLVLSA